MNEETSTSVSGQGKVGSRAGMYKVPHPLGWGFMKSANFLTFLNLAMKSNKFALAYKMMLCILLIGVPGVYYNINNWGRISSEAGKGRSIGKWKWPDKYTTSYDLLDFIIKYKIFAIFKV